MKVIVQKFKNNSKVRHKEFYSISSDKDKHKWFLKQFNYVKNIHKSMNLSELPDRKLKLYEEYLNLYSLNNIDYFIFDSELLEQIELEVSDRLYNALSVINLQRPAVIFEDSLVNEENIWKLSDLRSPYLIASEYIDSFINDRPHFPAVIIWEFAKAPWQLKILSSLGGESYIAIYKNGTYSFLEGQHFGWSISNEYTLINDYNVKIGYDYRS